VSTGLALLAYQGMEVSESEEKQTNHKEDFALAVPDEISPFTGTEKDGELVMSHPKRILSLMIFSVIQEHFGISGTRSLRKVLVPRNGILFNIGLRVITL
jgi:hypothetical protein